MSQESGGGCEGTGQWAHAEAPGLHATIGTRVDSRRRGAEGNGGPGHSVIDNVQRLTLKRYGRVRYRLEREVREKGGEGGRRRRDQLIKTRGDRLIRSVGANDDKCRPKAVASPHDRLRTDRPASPACQEGDPAGGKAPKAQPVANHQAREPVRRPDVHNNVGGGGQGQLRHVRAVKEAIPPFLRIRQPLKGLTSFQELIRGGKVAPTAEQEEQGGGGEHAHGQRVHHSREEAGEKEKGCGDFTFFSIFSFLTASRPQSQCIYGGGRAARGGGLRLLIGRRHVCMRNFR